MRRQWLIDLRGNRTQEEIARQTSITRAAYANIEIGQKNPSVRVAKEIAAVLEFDWTIFFDTELVETKQTNAS